MSSHISILREFAEVLKIEKNNSKLFSKPFYYQMIGEAIDTLENIHYLITNYQDSYLVQQSDGAKVLKLFGLLQGLFVGIDCLYTIGRASAINKIMINVNQNQVLREIKHIRNDVVGHPAYRYYESNVVGFCNLDLHNINDDSLIYDTIIYRDNKMQTTKHTIKMLNVIKQYYEESNAVLSQTLQFFQMKKTAEKWDLSKLVAKLGSLYLVGENNISLLKDIQAQFINKMKLSKTSSHRVIWRLNLIASLFTKPKNEYLSYLTIHEIYKVYSLLYQLEKQIDPSLKFYFPKFTKNNEFMLLQNKIKKTKNRLFDATYLHDNSHPLYKQNFEMLLSQYANDPQTANLRLWISSELEKNDRDMLYLIGSELKLN